MADDTRGPRERAWDDIIRPALEPILDLCKLHKVPVFIVGHLDHEAERQDGGSGDMTAVTGVGPMCGRTAFCRTILTDETIVGAVGIKLVDGEPEMVPGFADIPGTLPGSVPGMGGLH